MPEMKSNLPVKFFQLLWVDVWVDVEQFKVLTAKPKETDKK